MKKILALALVLCMMVPFFAFAEDFDLALDYSADVSAYAGNWVLVGAYLRSEGALAVPEKAATMTIELVEADHSVAEGALVDSANYLHNHHWVLEGTFTFGEVEGVEQDKPYTVKNAHSSIQDYPEAKLVEEGGWVIQTGATKVKINGNLFFSAVTGKTAIDEDDEELDDEDAKMNVLGVNAAGQLILGYSGEHIENSKNADAEWEFVYIFAKAE